METKKTGKILGIAVAVVIAVAGITLGIMAACGVFENHKKKAFELLAQMPERMGYSATNDYVGMKELTKAQQEKGSSSGISISNLKVAKNLSEEGINLSNFSVAVDTQANVAGSKTNTTLTLEKNNAPASFNCYTDKDKMVISAPELIQGKAFQVDRKSMSENSSDLDVKVVSEFDKDLMTFFEKEIEKVKEEIECEKLDEKDGYRLLVSKEAMDLVLDDFLAFMEKQQEMVNFINAYVDVIRARESAEEITPFDCMSLLKQTVEDSKSYTDDFEFIVYEMDGVLIGIETPVNIQNMTSSVSIEFAGVEADSTVTMDVSLTYNGYRATATLVKKSVVTDVRSVQLLLDVTVVGKPAASFTMVETIKPADNSYSATLNVTAMGEEIADLSATGYIKNLNKGESVNYVLDEVVLNIAGEEMLSMALDMHMGVLKGDIEPPQGEVVEYIDSSSLELYSEEMTTNILEIITDWDMKDLMEVDA